MKGFSFYFYLRNKLNINDIIGKSVNGEEYIFLGWSSEGDLIFNSSGQKKKIPSEMIAMCCYLKTRNIEINYDWVKQNGKDEYCIAPVIKKQLDDFFAFNNNNIKKT